jgi:hypothetical protein
MKKMLNTAYGARFPQGAVAPRARQLLAINVGGSTGSPTGTTPTRRPHFE